MRVDLNVAKGSAFGLALIFFVQEANMNNVKDTLMTRKEVSEYLRICVSSVDNLAIPNFKIGRSVRYRKSAVDEFLARNSRRDNGYSND